MVMWVLIIMNNPPCQSPEFYARFTEQIFRDDIVKAIPISAFAG